MVCYSFLCRDQNLMLNVNQIRSTMDICIKSGYYLLMLTFFVQICSLQEAIPAWIYYSRSIGDSVPPDNMALSICQQVHYVQFCWWWLRNATYPVDYPVKKGEESIKSNFVVYYVTIWKNMLCIKFVTLLAQYIFSVNKTVFNFSFHFFVSDCWNKIISEKV